MPAPATRIMDVCEDLRDAVVTYHGGTLPDRQFVSAGAPAWDCELLAVWCETTIGVEGSPELEGLSAASAGAAHTMRAGTFVVTLTRCAAQMDDSGKPPTEAEEETAATELYGDAQRTLNALIEAERAGDLPSCHGIAFSSWTVIGPDGGYVAGELRVQVALSVGGF